MENQSPSEHVLAKCGGAPVVANWLGLRPTAVYKWTYPSKLDGGTIPARWHQRILDCARQNGIDLSPEDFFRRDDREAA